MAHGSTNRGGKNIELGSIDHTKHMVDVNNSGLSNTKEKAQHLPSPQRGGGRKILEPLK